MVFGLALWRFSLPTMCLKFRHRKWRGGLLKLSPYKVSQLECRWAWMKNWWLGCPRYLNGSATRAGLPDGHRKLSIRFHIVVDQIKRFHSSSRSGDALKCVHGIVGLILKVETAFHCLWLFSLIFCSTGMGKGFIQCSISKLSGKCRYIFSCCTFVILQVTALGHIAITCSLLSWFATNTQISSAIFSTRARGLLVWYIFRYWQQRYARYWISRINL